MDFTEFNLNKKLLKGIKTAGFINCTQVQEETLALTLKKKDVCVQSQTGTGKTAAFLISIFQLLLEDEALKGKKTLIIAPTRELAVQIEKEAKLIGQYLDFSIGCFYGGVGYSQQEEILDKGIDIIVGTPGRLIDFNEKEKIHFNDISILIIDEADRLFDMGFFPDIQRMISYMPPAQERITMLFSATISSRVRDLAWQYMNDPSEIVISPETVFVDKITQELYHVGKDEKIKLLLGILKKEQPRNALIFTNMKSTAHEVCRRLEYNGIKCQYIMGDLPQGKRLRIIEKVKSGKIKFLVATEVAARGLHIDDLDLVVNYDLPEDCENYVHRIGRTARAGKSGKAISLACEKYVYGLEAIEAFTKYKIPVAKADDDLYAEDKSEGMRFLLDKSGREIVRPPRPHKASGPATRKKGIMIQEPDRQNRSRRKRYMDTMESGESAGLTSNEYNLHGNHTAGNLNKFAERTKTYTEQVPAVRKNKFYIKFLLLFSLRKKAKNKKLLKRTKIKSSKNGTLQERMEYYKKKYGANFIPGPELLAKEKEKKN